jgi:hypothetical protein
MLNWVEEQRDAESSQIDVFMKVKGQSHGIKNWSNQSYGLVKYSDSTRAQKETTTIVSLS